MTFGELFCGAGGFALGAAQAGYACLWANDNDEASCETFRRNINVEDKVYCEDVWDFIKRPLETPDVLLFGFPCSDFSHIGKREGFKGKHGRLYQAAVKFLKKRQPKAFVCENVKGILNDYWHVIHGELTQAGYRLSAKLYKLEEYGLPQTRHRLFCAGIRKDLNLAFDHLLPTCTKFRSISDCLENPPIPENAFNNEIMKHKPDTVERLKLIKPGENIWDAARAGRMPERLQMKIKTNYSFSHIYKRPDPNKPSYTITSQGGGGCCVYHYKETRALTNRERARIQSFPDDYEFMGGVTSVRKQIGNAVPPFIAERLLTRLRCILHEYDGR